MKLPLSLDIRSADSLDMDEGATGPPLRVAIRDGDDSVIDLQGINVRLRIDGETATGRIATDGDEIVYHWQEEDTDTPGEHPCQFVLRAGGGQVLKAPSYTPARLTIHRSP